MVRKELRGRPAADEYSPELQSYMDAAAGSNVEHVLHDQLEALCRLTSYLSADQVDKLHPPYRWTLRQVLEHCVDTERVFGYRLLRFAAGDSTPLPGFDQNAYVAARFALGGGVASLLEELALLRRATLLLIARVEPAAWDRRGEANGHTITFRALAWATAGHLAYHLVIMHKRLCVDLSSSS